MAKDFKTLVRMRKWALDEKQRELGEMLGVLGNLEAEKDALEQAVIAEQKVAAENPELAGFAYGGFANADRDIDFGQGDVSNGGGVQAFDEAVEIGDSSDSLVVTHAAVDDHTASRRVGGDGSGEVVPGKGSPDDFAEKFDYNDIAGDHCVDGPGVLTADSTFGPMLPAGN